MNPLLIGHWVHERTFAEGRKRIPIPFGAYKIHENGLIEYSYKGTEGKWIKAHHPSFSIKEMEKQTVIFDDDLNQIDSIITSVTASQLITAVLLGGSEPRYFFEFRRA
jgi:hypothetical protein